MDIDQKILKRVLDKGWLQLEDLIEKGLIQEESIVRMMDEIIAEEQNDLTQSELSEAPTSKPSQVAGVFGQYLHLELLGKGGMAEVFRAYDPELNRPVALKFLLAADPSLSQRLLREARSQAKIDHPNVCKVYEVGELNGRPYIAMQYISGKTLKEVSEELSIEKKLLLVKSLTEALHEAHRLGVIHRDIKPSNIMVETREDGEFVPYLVDFGLAREVEDPGTTATDVIVGTPWYMSPEQAMGKVHSLDRRSDVYSLGVMLYELLSNHLPYHEDAIASRAAIDQEPISLRKRNKSIPPDLETIVMKCLEKDPLRRYESSKALGEDLQRYLDGEPILAKRAGWSYRMFKKAKKNKAAAVILSAASLLTLFLVGMLIWVQWRSQIEKQYANEFAQEVRYIESMMRSVYMSPLHDIRSELAKAESRLIRIEHRAQQTEKWSFAPAQNALGQGYLAIREFEKAQQRLEKAWQAGYQQHDTAYALGRVLSFQYQQALAEAFRISNKEARETKRKEIDRLYRDQALGYLRKSQGHIDSPALIEGFIALHEKRYNIALEKANAANRDAMWSYEAKKLEADIYMEIGRKAYNEGNITSASENFNAAGKAYESAMQIGRSEQSIYLADCDRLLSMMRLQNDQGLSPTNFLKEILSRADQAISVNPEISEPYRKKALAYLYLGIYQTFNSKDDTRPTLKKSIDYSQEVIKRDPAHADAHREMAVAHVLSGEYELSHGENPIKSLSRATNLLEKAIQLNPRNDEIYKTSGNVYSIIGRYEDLIGKNPETAFQKSIQQFQKALQINPKNSGVFNNIGITCIDKAENESNHGKDPKNTLQNAIQSFQQSLQINPQQHSPHNNLGVAYLDLGLWEITQGRDPSSMAKQSIKECEETMRINPSQNSPLTVTASSYLLLVEYEIRAGKDPRLTLNRAKEFAQNALKRNPNSPGTYRTLGDIYRFLGLYDLHNDRDPASNLKLARLNAEKAISIDSLISHYFHLKGLIEIVAAQWSLKNNQNPSVALRTAKEAFQKTTELNSQLAENYQGLSESYRWEAEWKQMQKRSALEDINRGLESIDKALAVNPLHAESIATQGTLFLLKAKEELDPMKRAESADRAGQLLENALRINSLLKSDYESMLKQANQLSGKT